MKRLLTAGLLIPTIWYVIFLGHGWLLPAVAATVAVLCFHEFCALAACHGADCRGPLGYAAGLVIVVVPRQEFLAVTLVALLGLSLAARRGDPQQVLPRSAALVLGVVYIFGSLRCAPLLREYGPHWLFFAVALSWVGDTAAYYVGRRWGRHKLAPRISPSKSWEGVIASLAPSVLLGAWYLVRFVPSVGLLEAVALAALVNVAGQVGDLAESAIKRGAGVKDSGTLLPGHGGWLDRLDSTLFSLPVVYFWLTASAGSSPR